MRKDRDGAGMVKTSNGDGPACSVCVDIPLWVHYIRRISGPLLSLLIAFSQRVFHSLSLGIDCVQASIALL